MAEPQTILVIEDEPDTRQAVALGLEAAGFRVLQAETLEIGGHLLQTRRPDLVVLDLNLPDGSGLDFCRKVRSGKAAAKIPIVMLTSRRELDEKAEGFDAGADQYLVKPVPSQELTMWVKALLQRMAYDKDEGAELVAGDLTVSLDAHLVSFGDTTISDLTPKEFDLLYHLVKSRPKVLTRQYILSRLWHTVAVDRVVDTHISNLRRKLPPRLADRVQTVPGKGFRYFE